MRLTVFAALLVLLAACARETAVDARSGGNADNGALLLRQYGCGSCHVIPGVANAVGNSGPPLTRVGARVYLAGMLPNSPENMARWISDPAAVDPATAMPDLNVSEEHVRDMVAYLQKLR